MHECQWYEERKEAGRKRLLGDDPHHIPAKPVARCNHPRHAPVLRPGDALACGGSLASCPLTPEQRAEL